MKKTKEQKEFEEWYKNNMPPSRLPNLSKCPWNQRDNSGSYYWSDVSHGFKCYMAGRNHETKY